MLLEEYHSGLFKAQRADLSITEVLVVTFNNVFAAGKAMLDLRPWLEDYID